MQPSTIALIMVVLAAVAVLVWAIYNQNRRTRLINRFGPEYYRAVTERGSRWQAESELERRAVHADQVRHTQLSPFDRAQFLSQWKSCQTQFVDDPDGALDRADRLLTQVMGARGCYVESPAERSTDIMAAFPQHIKRYQIANEILERHRTSGASTQELRTAFLSYRMLFDELLGGYEEELRRAS